jgi:hypothetical protein
LDAAYFDAQTFGFVVSIHFVSLLEAGRKKFWTVGEVGIEPLFAKALRIVDNSDVCLFRNGQYYGMFSVTNSLPCGFVSHDTIPCS